jgi:deoxyribose-phosphate aldolase
MDSKQAKTSDDLASKIQSTLISNTLTRAQWEQHIEDCVAYRFNAAMIPGAWVRETAKRLQGSSVKVASFIDLPFGTMTSAGKAYEASRLMNDGAQELDLMPNVGFLLSGMEKDYAADIAAVVQAVDGIPVKVMLELPLLNAARRERAVALSIEAGVAYLKNASSGAVGVASPDDIRFLRRTAPSHIGVKASGGIKTLQQVRDLLDAGAHLAGTSAGVQIMRELQGQPSEADSRTLY